MLFTQTNAALGRVIAMLAAISMILSAFSAPFSVFAEGEEEQVEATFVAAPETSSDEGEDDDESEEDESGFFRSFTNFFQNPPTPKVTICHAAGNSGNYTEIEVSQNSVLGNGQNGHGNHNKDIIPPFGQFGGRNWDPVGQAIYNAGCKSPKAAVSVDAVEKLSCGAQDIDLSGSITFKIPTSNDSFVIKLDGNIVRDDEDIDDAGPDGVPQAWTHVLSSVGVGSHTVEVIIYDDAAANTGVKASDSIEFTIDACPTILRVEKVVVGSDAEASDFEFSVNEGDSEMFEDGGVEIEVTPGIYTVLENTYEQYSTEYENCSQVSVAEGETEVCIVTNTYIEDEIVPWCSFEGEAISWTPDVDAKKNNGQPVDANRRNISAVETVASYQNIGGSEGNAWSTSDFFSLGINGELVYEFTDKVAFDQAGDDIAVYEITGGNSATAEKANVFVSQNGSDWEAVGSATGDGSFDISITTFNWIKYVKVVDDSAGIQGANGDGYDVDAIVILDGSCGDEPIPEPVECRIGKNLLDNGSFEDPVVTNASKWQKFSPVLSWVIAKVSDSTPTTLEVHRGWSSNQAAKGEQYVELDGDHSTKVSQTVAVVPGAEYELSWAFAARHNITAEQNQLSVLIDGTEVATEGPATDSAGLMPADWTRNSYPFTAVNGSVTLTFADAGLSNTYGTFLDDAVLCMTKQAPDPEPEPEPETFTLDGYKWNDEDGDGVWDEGEYGIEGWTIYATMGEYSTSTLTDEDGYYSFEVEEGSWVVSEHEEDGWTQTGIIGDGADGDMCYYTFESEEDEQYYKKSAYNASCDFGNQEDPIVEEDDGPSGKSSGTRTGNSRKGKVLGAATQCPLYLNDYMRQYMTNNPFEVIKLQLFLQWQGHNVPLTATFDSATDAAVRAFQAAHKDEVLTPWFKAGIVPHENPTGFVFKTTKWKINDIVCPGIAPFPQLP